MLTANYFDEGFAEEMLTNAHCLRREDKEKKMWWNKLATLHVFLRIKSYTDIVDSSKIRTVEVLMQLSSRNRIIDISTNLYRVFFGTDSIKNSSLES